MNNLAVLLDQCFDIENTLYYEQKKQLYNYKFINLILDGSIKDLKLRVKKTKELVFQPIFSGNSEEKDTLFKLFSFISNIEVGSKDYYKIHLFNPDFIINSHFPIYLFNDEKYNVKIRLKNKEIFIKNVTWKSSMIISNETCLNNIENLNISKDDAKELSSNLANCSISIQLSEKGQERDFIFEKNSNDKYLQLNQDIEYLWIEEIKNIHIQMLQFGTYDYKNITKAQLSKSMKDALEFFNVPVSNSENFDLVKKIEQICFNKKSFAVFQGVHHFYKRIKKISLNSMDINLIYSGALAVDNTMLNFYERELSIIKNQNKE